MIGAYWQLYADKITHGVQNINLKLIISNKICLLEHKV